MSMIKWHNVEGHCYPSGYQLLLFVPSLASTEIFYGLLIPYFFWLLNYISIISPHNFNRLVNIMEIVYCEVRPELCVYNLGEVE